MSDRNVYKTKTRAICNSDFQNHEDRFKGPESLKANTVAERSQNFLKIKGCFRTN